MANTFHCVGEPRDFVRQAFDALRPGGRFVVVNRHDLPRETTTAAGEPRGPPTDLRLSPDATERVVLDAAEFTLQELVESPPYHYALVFER